MSSNTVYLPYEIVDFIYKNLHSQYMKDLNIEFKARNNFNKVIKKIPNKFYGLRCKDWIIFLEPYLKNDDINYIKNTMEYIENFELWIEININFNINTVRFTFELSEEKEIDFYGKFTNININALENFILNCETLEE